MCGIIIIIYEIIGSTYQHQNISSVRMKSEKLRQLHCPYNKYITTMTTKHTVKKKWECSMMIQICCCKQNIHRCRY